MFKLLTQALRRFPRGFIWCATLVGVSAMLAVFAAVIVDSRDTAWRFNEQALQNLAMLAEQGIARNVEMFDLSLQALREGAADPTVMALPAKLRHDVLFDRSSTARGLGTMFVLDKTGHVLLNSAGAPSNPIDLSGREYFQVHRDSPTDIGLFVSRPFRSRLNNQWLIGLSRRISAGDGSFLGVVVGGVRLDYIASLFEHLDLGPEGTISLLREDGVLVVGTHQPALRAGDDEAASPVFRKIDREAAGLFISADARDGIERLYAYRRLAGLPLLVSVGRSTREIDHTWWRKALTLSVILLGMSGTVIALMKLLDKEFARRIRAEQRSAALARTDGLTGLANRRMFDEAIRREWESAARDQTSLALLMIDGDWFKAFNDHHGHQAGDTALVGLAGVIGRAIRRARDLAARYGGEEFVVLLPQTELAGAAALAQKIRLGVQALSAVNPGSPFGHLTVSCGVAALTPAAGMDAQTLLKAADDALYQAKQGGRNRVVAADGPALPVDVAA